MPIFGRKKEAEEKIQELKKAIEMPIERAEAAVEKIEAPVEKIEPEKKTVEPEEAVEAEKPSFAPLFIKLDRYKKILSSMNEIKLTMVTIKNAFSVLSELDKLRAENLKMIKGALEKLDKKLLSLDSEFLRPTGFREEFIPDMYTAESLEGIIADLKSQVEQLKAELQSMS